MADAGVTRRGRPRKPPPRRPSPRLKSPIRLHAERQRRLQRRALPLLGVALVSFIVGAIMAAGSAEEDSANRFLDAWADQDFAAMHAELTPDSQAQFPLEQFAAAYQEAQNASTANAIDPGEASGPDNDVITMEVGIRTEIFGLVEGVMKLPYQDEKIAWDPHLTFPNLEDGERVGRRLTLGSRAAILSKDGTPLATGDSRDSPLGSAATDVAGEVGTPDAELRPKVEQSGYPGDQETGISGLELAFNSRLAGKPGGELLAVPDGTALPDVPESTEGRPLAISEQQPGQDVRTTIDSDLQEVTVSALGGQSGGVAVLDARNGEVKALAGSAYSAPQPPGSTFKVITTSAALEENEVKLDDTFDVVTSTNPSPDTGANVIDNAHDEPCGGTFEETFADSCNTVFAPLAVQVGADKLVEESEAYGFNQPVTLYDEQATEAAEPGEMTMPTDLESDETLTELAVTGIGQGRVLATPLGMASVAQTVAAGGKRSPTPIVMDPALRSDAGVVDVTSRENARVLNGLMQAVVDYGTATSADLGNIQVAGKTGTAELGPKPNQPEIQVAPGEEPPDPEQIVDAWFIAFAPAEKPKLAIAVMLIDAPGDGGEVAAPIAAQILGSALG